MNKVKELLVELKEQQIRLHLKGDDIKIASFKNKISPQQIQMIKSHKDDIIDYLRGVDENNGLDHIPVSAIKSSYPLSNAQQRVWILSQEEEGSVVYNLPTTINLIGTYDFSCFKRAIQSVIERHDILRTIFKDDINGEPIQVVLKPEDMAFDIDFQDFRTKQNPKKASEDYIYSDSYRPFNLLKGPLLRARLLQLTNDKFIFYYNMHHIISDGWSMEVLVRDVMHYYEAYVSGGVPDITPLKLQYKDYSCWQLNQINNSKYLKHKAYWVSLLRNDIPVIDLPTTKKRPQVNTFSGACLGVRISSEIVTKLRDFGSTQKGSLFMGLLTVYNVLLHHYTGENDIVIGNPIAGRDHPDLENQIGVYINTLALRNSIDSNHSFTELFNQIRETTLKAIAHQMCPFDKLLEELKVRRVANRNALFDILVNHLGVSDTCSAKIEENNISNLGERKVLFDLEVDFTEANGGVEFVVRYNTDVYEEAMVKTFMQHYINVMDALLNTPEKPIGLLKYLSEKEEKTQRYKFNNTDISYPLNSTVVDCFSEQVKKTPNAIALLFGDEKMTYKELDEKANHYAMCLMEIGIDNEDLVLICLEKGIEMIIGILAILKSGGAYVPIDSDYPKERIDFIVEDTKAKVILSTLNLKSVVDRYNTLDIIYLDKPLKSLNTTIHVAHIPKPNSLAYVIYTSGSTGKPKGVKIEHKALTNFLFSIRDHLTFNENLKLLSLTTFTFDISILEFLSPLLVGGKLILVSNKDANDPEIITNIIEKENPNCIQATPSRWQMIMSYGWKGNGNSILLSGGETINTELKKQLTALSSEVWNLYGPTETTIWSCISKLEENTKTTIGKPLGNTQIYILNKNLALVPQGAIGQLCISGLGLSRGYLNRPDLTANKFVPHPFKKEEKLYLTGDLARWLPDGTIEFLGRNDYQVKINGYRIELGEIEALLNGINDIEQSVVLALEDNNTIKQLVAYVVSKNDIDEQEIERHLQKKLPYYMIPRIYVFLKEIPLTHNGKLDRKGLPDPVIKQEYIAPNNETQMRLVEIWKDILQIDKVSVKDGFFQVGGNSLRAIRVLNAINKEFGLKYDLKGIYEENTIALIAERIEIDLRFKNDQELNENEFNEIRI